ncbi:hypothetical protein HZS_550 [Henneguya salminicola]|nr:hypothetical protein HZS_550 [Henneguya salminicola]
MFGIATGATGLFGVIIGGEITAFLRTKDRPIELYICIICCVLSSISLFFTIFFSLISLLTTWQIIGPLHRSKATAIQIVCIHALGDAISPFIIGLVFYKIILYADIGLSKN